MKKIFTILAALVVSMGGLFGAVKAKPVTLDYGSNNMAVENVIVKGTDTLSAVGNFYHDFKFSLMLKNDTFFYAAPSQALYSLKLTLKFEDLKSNPVDLDILNGTTLAYEYITGTHYLMRSYRDSVENVFNDEYQRMFILMEYEEELTNIFNLIFMFYENKKYSEQRTFAVGQKGVMPTFKFGSRHEDMLRSMMPVEVYQYEVKNIDEKYITISMESKDLNNKSPVVRKMTVDMLIAKDNPMEHIIYAKERKIQRGSLFSKSASDLSTKEYYISSEK